MGFDIMGAMNGTETILLDAAGIPVDCNALVGRTFEHFKGRRYRLEAFALDSETTDPVVVYRQLYADGRLWVRPARMFFERVVRADYDGPRFKLVD